MKMGPTFVHKNYIDDPTRCDPVSKYCDPSSGSYNKPAAVMHWSQEAQIAEEYVLYVDADMLLRAPLDTHHTAHSAARVVSEHVGYLDVGIRNGLVDNFVPGGEAARAWARAAGWYHIFHIDDLRTLAPDWLRYCRQMRTNPQLYWNINGSIPKNIPTGDAYVKYGEAPWISEMYGYVFSAAEHQIDTKLLRGLVEYTDRARRSRGPPARRSSTTASTATSGVTTLPSTTTATSTSTAARASSSGRRMRRSATRSCAPRRSTRSTTRSATFTARCARRRRTARRCAARRTSSPARPAPTSTRTARRKRRNGGCNTPAFGRIVCRRARSAAATPTRAALAGRSTASARRTLGSWRRRASSRATSAPPPAPRRRCRRLGGLPPRRRRPPPPPPPRRLGPPPPRRTRCRRTRRTSGRRARRRSGRRKRPTKRRRQRASPRRRRPRTSRPSTRRPRAPRPRAEAEAEAERVAAAAAKSRAFASRQGASAARALLPKLILVWAALSFGLALFVYRHFRRRRSEAVAQAGLPRAV